MAHQKNHSIANIRCDNCCFSTFATGSCRAVLICRQKKGSEGTWNILPLNHRCKNFYPSRFASPADSASKDAQNLTPRRIPLTKGKFTIVDAHDYPFFARYNWFVEGTQKNYYAVRKQNGKSIKMHRQITNAPDHLVVDHIDHNGLNNQRQNLRLCTFAQNCRNIRSTSPKTSIYKGVHWHKAHKKWAAQITCNKKTHHLGYFKKQFDAAIAYDSAAKKHHGVFAALNFKK